MSVLSIDFGTSNTVIAYRGPSGHVETLVFDGLSKVLGEEPPVIPTAVYIAPDGSHLIGAPAIAQNNAARIIRGFKRDLCQLAQCAPRYINGDPYTPIKATALFLQGVWDALDKSKIRPERVVFTVPVGAFENYINHIRSILADFSANVLFVDESTAAALYHQAYHVASTVLVVDIGGGTLDLSLVKLGKKRAEVIAKTDRAYGCGGQDVDAAIVRYALQKMEIDPDNHNLDERVIRELIRIAEKVKIDLSYRTHSSDTYFDDTNYQDWTISLTRSELEAILTEIGYYDILSGAIDELLSIAKAKGYKLHEINKVLMVGGSSLIPSVQQLVKNHFPGHDVQTDNPFEAVAHGVLMSDDFKIVDYLRHTYAIATWNRFTKTEYYVPIFEAGIPYPATSQEIILRKSSTTQKTIEIVIGELNAIGAIEVTYGDNHGIFAKTTYCTQTNNAFRPIGRHTTIRLNVAQFPMVDVYSVQFDIDCARTLRITVIDLIHNSVLFNSHAVAQLT